MEKEPILISVPHGGDVIPLELRDKTILKPADIFWDGDGCTRQIYDFSKGAQAFVDAKIARAFVDLNRDRLDCASKNPDGVIKSETCFRKPVYRFGEFPGENLIEELLKKYYDPFHRRLDQALVQNSVKLAIDCHSMLPASPVISQNPGQNRPLFCISNGGDLNGEKMGEQKPITCPAGLLRLLKRLLLEAFNINSQAVLLNQPFSGGHIMRSHHRPTLKKPWIQFEINRKLYIEFDKMGSDSYFVSDKTTAHLRDKIWDVFKKLIKIL